MIAEDKKSPYAKMNSKLKNFLQYNFLNQIFILKDINTMEIFMIMKVFLILQYLFWKIMSTVWRTQAIQNSYWKIKIKILFFYSQLSKSLQQLLLCFRYFLKSLMKDLPLVKSKNQNNSWLLNFKLVHFLPYWF